MNVGRSLFNWGPSNRREKAIKDLLARSGHKLDNWTALGLAGTLKLPMAWIDEAKVSYLLSTSFNHTLYLFYFLRHCMLLMTEISFPLTNFISPLRCITLLITWPSLS